MNPTILETTTFPELVADTLIPIESFLKEIRGFMALAGKAAFLEDLEALKSLFEDISSQAQALEIYSDTFLDTLCEIEEELEKARKGGPE